MIACDLSEHGEQSPVPFTVRLDLDRSALPCPVRFHPMPHRSAGCTAYPQTSPRSSVGPSPFQSLSEPPPTGFSGAASNAGSS